MLISKEITRDDLDLYVRDFGSGMRFIKHPLVNELVIADFEDEIPEDFKRAILPKGYDAKTFGDAYVVKINFKQELLDEAINQEDWDKVFMLIEKPYRLSWLEENYDLITDEKAYYEFLKDAYIQSEFPMDGFYDYEDLLKLFWHKNYPKLMMDKDELGFYNQLPQEITIWRGIRVEEELDEENIGFSFTLDKERAEWFAKRFSQDGKGTPMLIEAKVKKDKILSVFLNRGEEEVLVSPDNIEVISLKEIP